MERSSQNNGNQPSERKHHLQLVKIEKQGEITVYQVRLNGRPKCTTANWELAKAMFDNYNEDTETVIEAREWSVIEEEAKTI